MKFIIFLFASLLSAQTLDIYGGFTAIPSPNGATGYFRVEKFRNRWMFVTPLGNAFWMRSVYAANLNLTPNPGIISEKYGAGGSDSWAVQRNKRFQLWGTNTLGEYTSSVGLPVGVYGSSTFTSPQLPFIVIYTPAQDIALHVSPSTLGCTQAGKDVLTGVPLATYDGYRGSEFVDPYDPCYAAAAAYEVNYWEGVITGGTANKPWIVGKTMDDADSLYCIKSHGGNTTFQPYPHCGFLVATAAPYYSTAQNVNQPGTPFLEPKLYAKEAWINYLKAKYSNSISALNTAWGTSGFYTTFDDTPGSHTGEVVYTVGSRVIVPYNFIERTNTTTGGDIVCQPRGTGACIGVIVRYSPPCDSGTLMVGQNVTITNAVGQFTGSSFNGTFAVTAIQNGNPYPCMAQWAQSATAYDEGPVDPGGGLSPTISFTETVTSLSLAVANAPITAGTLTLSVPGGVTATDDGMGHLTGTGIAAGSTVTYATGNITLNLNSAPPAGDITASYTGSNYGSGTGVLDEDGRHTAWMGTMGLGNYVDNASSGVLTDLNGFGHDLWQHYAQVNTAAIHAVDTNHLVFGPASINNYGAKARDFVLSGLSDGGVDVFCWNYDPIISNLAGSMTEDNASYDLVGKPAFIWYSVNANADSDVSSSMGAFGSPQFANQSLRGQHMVNTDLPNFFNAHGANGDYYVIGYDWWSLYDSATEGGGTNWGMLTFRDNNYDGLESVTATVTCQNPNQAYTCGGEAGNYGNFISLFTQANTNLVNSIMNFFSNGVTGLVGGSGRISSQVTK